MTQSQNLAGDGWRQSQAAHGSDCTLEVGLALRARRTSCDGSFVIRHPLLALCLPVQSLNNRPSTNNREFRGCAKTRARMMTLKFKFKSRRKSPPERRASLGLSYLKTPPFDSRPSTLVKSSCLRALVVTQPFVIRTSKLAIPQDGQLLTSSPTHIGRG